LRVLADSDIVRSVMPDVPAPRLERQRLFRTLESFAWADTLTLSSFDVSLGIRMSHGVSPNEIVPHLPPDWTPGPASANDHHIFSVYRGGTRGCSEPDCLHIYNGTERIARSPDRSKAMYILESAMHSTVAEASRRWLFVHAGVIGWRGHAIVLPGKSHAGKTTLVAALIRAGATYYSDEYAIIDEHGLVHPFAKALSIRQPGVTRRVPTAELGADIGTMPLPVGLVVDTHYQSQAAWRPRTLSPGEIVLALVANTVRARLDPPLVLKRLTRAARHATGFAGPRGEASEIALMLLRAAAPSGRRD
jgi:hypothetical protein